MVGLMDIYLESTSRSRSVREFSIRKMSPSSAEKDLAMVLFGGGQSLHRGGNERAVLL